ncbi:MAG: hypothetical protein M5U28_00760 [Sandaracinaceae bacterium]|nr:hypothetical protein [Sandaracinaceae bacterium]
MGNRSPRFSGAVFDARRNAWRAMSSDGMPDRLPEAIEVGAGGALVRLSTDASGGVRYDVRADRWSPIAPAGAPSSRVGAAVVAADGRVMVWGGQGAGLSTDGAVYDVRADRWTPMSTAGAPSPRLAPFAAPTASGMVVWSGAAEHGSPARLSDGGVYDARADRWTSIPASGAPDPSIGGIFPQDLAWTGEALLYRELPGPDRGLPRRLALYDLARERWWRTAEASHVRPVVLAHGRVLLLDPAAPRVLHAREELACPVDLGRVPLFGNLSQGTSFAASALIGDELVLWGRVDVEALRPPCPPGAPCMPAESAVSALPRGVVITP